MIHPIQALSVKETFFQTLLRKLKSHRVIWCYIYLTLYVWLAVYAMLKYENSANTIIVTTGGLCGTIISVYILGTSYENTKYGEQMIKQYSQNDVDPRADER